MNQITSSSTFINSNSHISSLPEELILKFFSCLSADGLEACYKTCKQWKRIADTEVLWKAVYAKSIFGKEEWKTYFGDVGEVPSLPTKVYRYLNRRCPIWPNWKVHESHLLVLVPQTVNGKPLNLKVFGELVKNPYQGYSTGYNEQLFSLGEYNDSPTLQTHWTLMTRGLIPGSRSKTYSEQQQLIQSYAGYEGLHILDATIGVMVEYVRSGKRLYGATPHYSYSRCQEKWDKDWLLIMGGLDSSGLIICRGNVEYRVGSYGVGICRTF